MLAKLFLILILFLISSCELDEPEEIHGCCDEDAWNFDPNANHDTNDDPSTCIYNFEFSNPIIDTLWLLGSTQTISWTGGDSNLNLSIYIADESQYINDSEAGDIIKENIPNTGTYSWEVNDDVDGIEIRRICLTQDINSDGGINSVDDLLTYSENFFIIEEPESFVFESPIETDVWEEGSIQTIEWTGGTTAMPLKISLIEGEDPGQTLGTIELEATNTGSYEWTVECFGECSDEVKWLSIQQDWNGDEADEYGLQYIYSERFTITPEDDQ